MSRSPMFFLFSFFFVFSVFILLLFAALVNKVDYIHIKYISLGYCVLCIETEYSPVHKIVLRCSAQEKTGIPVRRISENRLPS